MKPVPGPRSAFRRAIPLGGPRFSVPNAGGTANAPASATGGVEHDEPAVPPDESFFDQDLLG